MIDPLTGEVKTFNGWRDPNYKPAPGATPYPGLLVRRVHDAVGRAASRAPRPPRRPAPRRASAAAGGDGRRPSWPRASSSRRRASTAPADTAFSIEFDNQDAAIPHNVEIKDAPGSRGVQGRDLHRRRDAQTTTSRRSPPGSYPFVCTVHPNMTGTLTVK